MAITSVVRRTVEELETLYEFEPSLKKAIYVEGITDRELIKLYLTKLGIDDVYVYEIDTIDIPDEIVKEKGFTTINNRSRAITLSEIAEKCVLCIIDSDFAFIEPDTFLQNNSLLKTDYSCMEMYCFNEVILEKIFLGYPTIRPSNLNNFLNELGIILSEIFLIRFAKENLNSSLPHIDFDKNITKKSHSLIFDRTNYLKKYLSNKEDNIKVFNDFISSTKLKMATNDLRYYINGHDFVNLLQLYLNIKQRDAKETFEKLLYGFLDFNSLSQEELFSKLAKYSFLYEK